MTVSSIGSSFQYIAPAAAVRQTAPAEPAPATAAETLADGAARLASGPTLASTTPFQRLADRMADAAVSLQEGAPAGSGASPREASDAYRAVAAGA